MSPPIRKSDDPDRLWSVIVTLALAVLFLAAILAAMAWYVTFP